MNDHHLKTHEEAARAIEEAIDTLEFVAQILDHELANEDKIIMIRRVRFMLKDLREKWFTAEGTAR